MLPDFVEGSVKRQENKNVWLGSYCQLMIETHVVLQCGEYYVIDENSMQVEKSEKNNIFLRIFYIVDL
jgi:hypothetical protein